MKNKTPIKIAFGVALLAFMIATTFYACKKELKEDQNITKLNAVSSASAIPPDEVSVLLDDWWANYAVFKNITYKNNVTPNLNTTVSRDYAEKMLHYSLNVALVNVDSTYEEETTDSVFYNFTTASDGTLLSKNDVCLAFDNIREQIKGKLQNTELIEKTINNITLYDNSTSENSMNLTVIFSATGGGLIATSDPFSGPNVATSFFPSNLSVPWASKSSGQGSTFSTNPYFGYWFWLFTGNIPSTVAEKNQGYNMLPSEKPAHQYLTSNQLFWPVPLLSNSSSLPATGFTTGLKYVKSPNYIVNGTIKTYEEITNNISSNIDPTDQLGCQDVITCNNAHKDDLDENKQDASYILSYDEPEYLYPYLQAIRRLDGSTLNFYWTGRVPAATAGYYKKSSKIANLLSKPALAGGYYAVTKLNYKVHDNGITLQVCFYTTCGINTYSICDRQANYVVDERFDHFTIQKMTPKEFLQLFA